MSLASKHIASLIRGIILVLVIAYLSNQIYTKYLWKDDLRHYDAGILNELYEKQDSADIMYFGESSNFSYHPDDTDTRSISEMINNQVKWKIATLNKGAYHAGIYIPLIRRLNRDQIKLVVVTMNMRTLNQSTIHAPIETSLQKQRRLFELNPPLLNRVLLTLNAYDDATLAERDKAMWYDWTYDTLKSNQVNFKYPTISAWCAVEKFPLDSGGEDMEKRQLADHNIKSFAFQIDPETNPRIVQFDEIVEVCRQNRFKLVFNLLADNVEYADSLVGPELVWLMRQNRDFMVDRYQKNGVLVVDNLEAVGGEHYTDQNWTTEHYDEIGRKIIADNVAVAIRKALGE